MKVLWFSNSPAGGEAVLNSNDVRGGWLSSLNDALNVKVDLTVVFYYARFVEPFVYNNVRYLPICKKNWKLNIIKNNLFGDFIDSEDLTVYLDIIKKIQPDVIHLHGTENPFGCIMGKTEIPVVLSIQGNYTVTSHKYFNGIEREFASISSAKIFSPYTWLFSKSYNYQFKNSSVKKTKREKRNFYNCKHIIGRTDWDRRITRILAPKSQYYHNDEILRALFYKNEWKNLNSQKLIVHSTIGEAPFKGFETICQSLSELNIIGTNIEWRVAGISENGLLNKVVRKKLKNSYPTKGLVLLGSLNEQTLITRMLEADMYVMPSHIENSPNSLCEAMIMGMPCITTLAGGSSSLLKDKEDGLVIQDGDPWSMAGAILELVNEPETAIKYGQNARDKAIMRHNPDKIVQELIEIYKKVQEKEV